MDDVFSKINFIYITRNALRFTHDNVSLFSESYRLDTQLRMHKMRKLPKVVVIIAAGCIIGE